MVNKKIRFSYWTLIIISPVVYWCVFFYSMNDMGRRGVPMIQGMEILALPSLIKTFIALLIIALLLWRKGFSDETKRKRSLWVGIMIILSPFMFFIEDIPLIIEDIPMIINIVTTNEFR